MKRDRTPVEEARLAAELRANLRRRKSAPTMRPDVDPASHDRTSKTGGETDRDAPPTPFDSRSRA